MGGAENLSYKWICTYNVKDIDETAIMHTLKAIGYVDKTKKRFPWMLLSNIRALWAEIVGKIQSKSHTSQSSLCKGKTENHYCLDPS